MKNPLKHSHYWFLGLALSVGLTVGWMTMAQKTQEITHAQEDNSLTLLNKKYALEKPDLAMDKKGDVVLVWQQKMEEGYDVFAATTHTDRVYLGRPVKVNSYTQDDQKLPRVAIDNQGNFMVVWESFKQDGSGSGVFGQRFDAQGKKQGVEFRVNTASKGSQADPHIAMDGAGNSVVVWTSEIGYGREKRIFLQTFDPQGTRSSAETKVDTVEGDVMVAMENPRVAMTSASSVLVVWQTLEGFKDDNRKKNEVQSGPTAGWNIKAQGFDLKGAPAKTQESTVNATAEGSQFNPAVSALGESSFLVAWEKDLRWDEHKELDLTYKNIKAAVLNSAGTVTSGELDVDPKDFKEHQGPEVVLIDGKGMIFWQEKNVDSHKDKITWSLKAQTFDPSGAPVGDAQTLNSEDAQPFWNAKTSSNTNQTIGIVWKGDNPRSQKGAIRFMQFAVKKPVSAAATSAAASALPKAN